MQKQINLRSTRRIRKHIELHVAGQKSEHIKKKKNKANTKERQIKMSFAIRDVPIKLKATTEIDEDVKQTMQTLVQLYDNGEKKKGEVPIFTGGDAEAMIRTLRKFTEVADDLDFTEPEEKFINFKKCLHDITCDDWDTVRTQYPITLGRFTSTEYSWKGMILPEDACLRNAEKLQ
jgi:hypothetical protein